MSNCSCNKRVLSNVLSQNYGDSGNTCGELCRDVCTTPQCGDPRYLTILAPVIYDELGINVCRTIPLAALLADYPTTAYISAEVIDIAFGGADANPITISQIASRPNCYEITLTNLSVTFALKLYDCCRRLLATETLAGIIYLPPLTTDPDYDPDTNPTSVSMEIFAPYGVVYTDGNVSTPELNFVGFSSTNSTLNQGLNLLANPKVLNFDIAGATVTIGLTLIVKSIYFNQYMIPHNGKAIISKGRLSSTEDSVCMDFVCGSLLDRNIKPLEICNPYDNKEKCDSCTDPNDCACLTPSDT